VSFFESNFINDQVGEYIEHVNDEIDAVNGTNHKRSGKLIDESKLNGTNMAIIRRKQRAKESSPSGNGISKRGSDA
jgi:hypothetical protein